MERTWKIRSQVGVDKRANVIWGDEREVTLAQYRAEIDAAKAKAEKIFKESRS